MPLILISNDDGIHAEGIRTLYEAVRDLAETWVVAPDAERSASGHSLTLDRPLRIREHAHRWISVSGTPTDAVAVGVEKLLPRRPSLILSGINHGPNLGDDITYSGTVAAALEGTIMNIPSIAVSLDAFGHKGDLHFETAAHAARHLAMKALEHSLPYDTLLNVNVPNIPDPTALKGYRITRQGRRAYENAIRETLSPWGEPYYWIGGGQPYWEHAPDTDIRAIQEGFVSVTPLHLDMTNYEALGHLRGNERYGFL